MIHCLPCLVFICECSAEFVVTGFGLFFVFSVKQAPDRKMRNFRKSVAKPAVIVNKRLSSISSRTSNAVWQIC